MLKSGRLCASHCVISLHICIIALSQGLHITQFGQFWSGVGLFLVFHNVF